MKSRRARNLALWAVCLAAALWVVAHARYITDLSAFLPAHPTPMQRLLMDQLSDGPASRLILIALQDGDAATRAAVSTDMARRLRQAALFARVENGAPLTAEQDRQFLFQQRYLLSDAVAASRFTTAGLSEAIEVTIDTLASSGGPLLKSLVPHDPTGEMLQIVDQLARTQAPATREGVWVSADGARTLLVAQTSAAGSDTDAQERALQSINAAFAAAARAAGGSAVRLRVSGPGVFAVAARAKIKRAATRLSVISSVLVVLVLLAAYRSVAALLLGLLPVVSGALAGIATVALGFGAIHGITLGFGITLIGEAVDYSIYFFIQARQRHATSAGTPAWQQGLWPTVRLGMLTSVCGFASLLPAGFPGLAQLGLYSISGLIAAGLVTRFVLPELLPPDFRTRDLTSLGMRIGRVRQALQNTRLAGAAGLCTIAAVAVLVLWWHRGTLWNRELASLSPISAEDLRFDATLRADLGAVDVLDLVVVSGPDLETVLRGAERVLGALQPLIDQAIIGGVDSPSRYLPSQATQRARREALPDAPTLRDRLSRAVARLNLREDQLSPFIGDVQAARAAPLLTAENLRGTSLAAGFAALVLHESAGWSALLPLHAAAAAAGAAPTIDADRVSAALAAAAVPGAQLLDMKAQTDALYGSYLKEATTLSLAGFAAVVLLLLLALRSPARVARVLVPLVLAVLVVAAVLTLAGQRLTLLHLVGMLLIVAVGSNYALFFDRERNRPGGSSALTLASLVIANVSTVIGFGLLSFSQVPVLEDLGMTVAPGAFMALLFSAAMVTQAGADA